MNGKSIVFVFLVACTSCIYSFNLGAIFFRRPSPRHNVFDNYHMSSADSDMYVEVNTNNVVSDFTTFPSLSSLSDPPSPPPFMVPASEVEEKYDDGDNTAEVDDPYSDILNMDAPIVDQEQSSLLRTQWSIESHPVSSSETEVKKVNSKSKKIQWEHWDAFMDEQFGDMDREILITDEDKWILELRDAVELKRGFAIWSKRSDEEVKREMKKYLAAKAMRVPDYVENIVRCVYLEKLMSMKEMRNEHELDVINFRKWMIEKRRKTKKDPLVPAKLEVSKNWLFQHPSKFDREKTIEKMSVVMDEKRQPSSTSMITVSDKDPGAPTAPTATGGSPAPSSAAKAGSTSGAIVTYSMLNWDKDVEDEMAEAWNGRNDVEKKDVNEVDKFYIDDEEILVYTEDDYYCVM